MSDPNLHHTCEIVPSECRNRRCDSLAALGAVDKAQPVVRPRAPGCSKAPGGAAGGLKGEQLRLPAGLHQLNAGILSEREHLYH